LKGLKLGGLEVKSGVHKHNRKVIAGTRTVSVSDARPFDIAMLWLISIWTFGGVFVCAIMESVAAIVAVLMVDILLFIIEFFYYYWSRFKELPPKVIYILVGIEVYLGWLSVLYLRGSSYIWDAIVSVFLISGSIVSFMGILHLFKNTKCSLEVEAICVDIETEHRTGIAEDGALSEHEVYTKPVFRIPYGNNSYITIKKSYYEDTKFEVGDKTTLYVNPKNFNEFRYSKDNLGWILLATGVWFILGWVFCEVVLNIIM
jgi:hypothetical protein